MNGNVTIRKLLEDEKCGEVLELYEKCEINSFLEIEKYYSGGCMELNENNVIDILKFSIYYNDNGIMRICKRYLKKHMNDSIMVEIFSILKGLNVDQLNELRDMSEDYLKVNGFKYLNNDSLLLKLDLKCLKFLLNNKNLMIIDESWLLNQLMLWYRSVLKERKDEEENEEIDEEVEEFISIIKTKIHLNEIKLEKLNKENLLVLKELKIEINEYVNNHINMKIEEVKNGELIRILNENYLEEDRIILKDNEKEMLKSEEMKIEMIKLLLNEDMKIVEIVLNVIIDMKMDEIIPIEIKNKLLGLLCYDYNKNPKKLILKCLCLFVDDKKHISTIEDLCRKEILYQILNEEYSLKSKSKELLIEYIQEMKLSVEEEEEMRIIIMDKELLKELLIKEISSFSYPQSEYLFGINEEISIIPSCDGERCEFSVNPSLPSGILIEKESGIIHGKVDKSYEKIEYEVKCKNIKNEKKFKMSLEFVDIKFTELNKNSNIRLSNNCKVVTNTSDHYNHCYLNLKMENGIYHIKYQYHQNRGDDAYIMLGLSTDNAYSGYTIYNESTTCNYYAFGGKSQDITGYCRIGRVVNSNPNFNNHGDGSIYEIIVDMNKREFWISHNNSSPVLLVKDLPSPLYPYAVLYSKNSSFNLLSVSHQN